jgi:hypothetical protein
MHELTFHCFNEVDIMVMNYPRDKSFHYFNEVDTLAKLSSKLLVSFFRELDTRSGTMLRPDFIIMNRKSGLPRVALLMGGRCLGSRDPMPPEHYAR